jgi:uncharacterized protein
MSEHYIPEHVDPFRYAELQLTLHGLINIANMKRLNISLAENHQPAVVDLQFGVDEQGVNYLKGQLKVNLMLSCQRCLEPFSYEIMSDFVLGIVDSLEGADALPEHYEPAIVTDGQLALRDLIEDEIILNLPIIPRHEPEMCKVKLPLTDSGWEQGKGKNPFHVLASLKHKQK